MVNYIDQALEVMEQCVDFESLLTSRELTIMKAQVGTHKLVNGLHANGTPKPPFRLTARNRSVRVWIEFTATEVICFAIEVSDDRGGTWRNPL